jgi:hypothetical protein
MMNGEDLGLNLHQEKKSLIILSLNIKLLKRQMVQSEKVKVLNLMSHASGNNSPHPHPAGGVSPGWAPWNTKDPLPGGPDPTCNSSNDQLY